MSSGFFSSIGWVHVECVVRCVTLHGAQGTSSVMSLLQLFGAGSAGYTRGGGASCVASEFQPIDAASTVLEEPLR